MAGATIIRAFFATKDHKEKAFEIYTFFELFLSAEALAKADVILCG
jgi:hypothetical protein